MHDYAYSGSNDIEDVAEYQGNNDMCTKPIGGKAPNELGVYDMTGNVREWCNDWYGEYPKDAVKDPVGPEVGGGRVLRGGGWSGDGRYARSAQRYHFSPDYRYSLIGFRLARGQSSQEDSRQASREAGQAARSDDGSASQDVWSRLKGIFKKQ